MIVLASHRLPTEPENGNPPGDDDRRRMAERREEEAWMNTIGREFRDVQRRLSRLLDCIKDDTMAPIDPWRRP